jgi:hypothetical protein
MLTCPMCKKKLRGLEKECLNCRTDVSLLVEYVENLREGLEQAEAYTRQGELGEAVWAYLAVLEVDPDNAKARRQVGQVATAVRQFDRTVPGRRWLKRLQKQTRFRRWLANWTAEGNGTTWLNFILWFLLLLVAFLVGYYAGTTAPRANPAPEQQAPAEPAPAEPAQPPKS